MGGGGESWVSIVVCVLGSFRSEDGEGVLTSRSCSSLDSTFLALRFTDFDTESYRPRGAAGFLFAEFSAFWAYLG